MSRAGLLGVRTADNLGACDIAVSLRPVLGCADSHGNVDCRWSVPYSIAWVAWKLKDKGKNVSASREGENGEQANWTQHVRSLLAGEALEDDLGVVVDAQVLNRLAVGTRGRAV